MTAQPADPFGVTVKTPSCKFPTIGTTCAGTITEAPTMVQSRDINTGEPQFWPDGGPKLEVVTQIALEPTGEPHGLWAKKGSLMFKAIQAAAGGKPLVVGGRLSVTYTGDVPGKMATPAKDYKVTYTPPDAFAQAPTAIPAAQGWNTPQQGALPDYVYVQPAQAAPGPITYTDTQRAAAKAAGIPLPR